MRLYLAGPMAGVPNFNYPAFKAEAALLRGLGHEVFSPAERDMRVYGEEFFAKNPDGDPGKAKRDGFSLREALKADVAWICEKGEGIYMMHGWENSKGSRMEHALAVALGLTILYATD